MQDDQYQPRFAAGALCLCVSLLETLQGADGSNLVVRTVGACMLREVARALCMRLLVPESTQTPVLGKAHGPSPLFSGGQSPSDYVQRRCSIQGRFFFF